MSKNVICQLYCSKCPTQYVRETRNLTHRNESHTKVVEHFIKHGLQAIKGTTGHGPLVKVKRYPKWIGLSSEIPLQVRELFHSELLPLLHKKFFFLALILTLGTGAEFSSFPECSPGWSEHNSFMVSWKWILFILKP